MIRNSIAALSGAILTVLLVFTMNNIALAATSSILDLDKYDVTWTTPSADSPGREDAPSRLTDSRGSMPLGNGEVGINAWVEPGGDLRLLIGRNDSYSEVSRLLKVGAVRVSLSPNPFTAGDPFRQRLHLKDGAIEITAGKPGKSARLTLFVDTDHPVIHCAGRFDAPTRVTVTAESWRTESRTLSSHEKEAAWTMNGAPYPLVESADVFPVTPSSAVIWYHRNETSCVSSTLDLQGLTSASDKVTDPLLHRTFGGLIEGDGFVPSGARSLTNAESARTFAFRVACPCAETKTAGAWIALASRAVAASSHARAAARRTRAWWRRYWDSAWIEVTGETHLASRRETASPGAEGITRGYLLQRYMQACGGRGPFPIKFNGGQFTVSPDGDMNDSDWRRWGDCHWWQNARLMYHPMLAQGDFVMMDPLFRMYEAGVPLAEERSRLIEHVGGAYFPETMTVWGTYANSDFGWDRTGRKAGEVASPWWAKTRNQGPELVALMLDRWDYTQDKDFLQKRLLPIATSILTYFDQRYRRDDAGKIVLDPTQALETLWTCVDDTPTIAGLLNITQRLTALPESLTTPEQRSLFARISAACPAIPTETHKGKDGDITVIAPARTYDPHRSNVENPETYAIWPFRLYGVGKPDLQLARDTYAARVNKLPVGWGYDGNVAAVLGLAGEAAGILQQQCDNSNPDYRWPATWGPNFDWLPDQNHGGNLLETAQLMLLQSDGRKILLFPAWPKTWDVRFKLHAAYNTVVEATLENGKVTRLVVTPEARRKDVVDCLDGA